MTKHHDQLSFKEACKLLADDRDQYQLEDVRNGVAVFPWEFKQGAEKLLKKFKRNKNGDYALSGYVVAVDVIKINEQPLIHDCQGSVHLVGRAKRVVFYPTKPYPFETTVVEVLRDVVVGKTFEIKTQIPLAEFPKAPKVGSKVQVYYKMLEEQDEMSILVCTLKKKS